MQQAAHRPTIKHALWILGAIGAWLYIILPLVEFLVRAL